MYLHFRVRPTIVRLGDNNLKSNDDDKEVQEFVIVDFIKHPDYSSSTQFHDIALIKLASHIKYNTFLCF